MNHTKLILFALFCSNLIYAGAFNLGDKVSVEVIDPDSTIQALEPMGIPEPTICLWDGDAILTFAVYTEEDFKGSISRYKKAFEKSLPEQGAKNVSVKRRKNFKSPTSLEIESYKVELEIEGNPTRQILYIAKLEKTIHLTIYTMIGAANIDAVAERTDAIMQTATTKPEPNK